jgi:hypothetical protein
MRIRYETFVSPPSLPSKARLSFAPLGSPQICRQVFGLMGCLPTGCRFPNFREKISADGSFRSQLPLRGSFEIAPKFPFER